MNTQGLVLSTVSRVVPRVVLGWVFFSSFALAQPDAPPVHGGKPPHMAQMEDKLGLTDEQVQKMREIRDNGGSMADMRAVLTPEQQAKVGPMHSQHRGKAPVHPEGADE